MTRRNTYIFCLTLAGLLHFTALRGDASGATSLGGAQKEVGTYEEDLAPKDRSSKDVPLIIHRMHSWPPKTVTRAKLYQTIDETLLSPDATIRDELDWGAQAGAVAFVQEKDFPGFLQAAQGSDVKLVMMMNVEPMRAALSKIEPGNLDTVVDYFVRSLDETASQSDGLYKIDGRPVIIVFAAYNYTAEDYGYVREGIREAGYDPILLYQAHSVRRYANQSSDEDYMRVFDGAFVWGGGAEKTRQTLERLIPARDALLGEGEERVIYLTVKAGHYRPEKGSLHDRYGTKDFRHTLLMAYEYDVDGIIIESWNDYSENHHIQPSMMNSTVMSDLCVFYSSQGEGNASAVFEEPGVYLSHRQEVMLGDVLDLELLHLPVGDEDEVEITLGLESAQGDFLYQFKPWVLHANEAKAITYSIPTTDIGARVLVPYIEVDGKRYDTSTFVILRDGRIERMTTVHASLANTLALTRDHFSLRQKADGTLIANLDVASDKKLNRIEIIRNEVPVYSAAYERYLHEQSPDQAVHAVGFYWSAPGPVPSIDKDFSGTVEILDGKFLQVFEAGRGDPVSIKGNTAEWQMLSFSPRCAIETVFNGKPGTLLKFRMPTQDFEATVAWKDLIGGKEVFFQINPYAQLLVKAVETPIGYPIPWNGYSFADNDIRLPTQHNGRSNVYYLRVIGEDGSIYRSAPVVLPAKNNEPSSHAVLWDAELGSSFEIESKRDDYRPVYWNFDTAADGIHRDKHSVGFDALLGGSYERDGRYQPDQIPELVPGKVGKAFSFDGNDVVFIRPNLIPPGAFYLDFWMKPEDLNAGKDQMLFHCAGVLSIQIQDGKLEAVFGDDTEDVMLSSQYTIKSGAWYRITFIYDLEYAALYLDGELEDRQRVEGYRSNISGRSTIGSMQGGGHMSGAIRGFVGLIDEVTVGIGVPSYFYENL